MTINRDGNEVEIECDRCTNTTDSFDKNDFSIMVATAKSDDWEIAPDHAAEGGWRHLCPDCRSTSALQRAKDLLG